MHGLYATFSSRHVILPVIHVASAEQAIRNTEIAQECGADGVFLINHTIPDKQFLTIYAEVKQRFFPRFWVGVNCLGLRPEEVFAQVDSNTSGVWVDDAFVDEDSHQDSHQQARAESIDHARRKHHFIGLYFGGVAYAHQRKVADPVRAAERAFLYLDVLTTSGPDRTETDHVARIAAMKAANPAMPLAIASGITPENVHAYLPHANAFLVGTGISASFEELDPQRVRTLVATVRAYNPEGPRTDIPLRYEETCLFGYRHGRMHFNPSMDITAHGRMSLGQALAIALQQTSHVAHYLVDAEHGLVLFSRYLSDKPPGTRTPDRPLNASETADLVWDWLQHMPMKEEAHDGVSIPGFRIYNHRGGIVGSWWHAIVAIKPMYCYLHK